MTLLRRAPREVYRVYSEAEFFDGAAGMELLAPTSASGEGERRLRRLAGAAMLAGAVGTMGGAVVLAGSRPTRGSGRRAGSGDAHALARTGLPTRADGRLTRSSVAGGAGVARTASLTGRARFLTERARFVARARAEHTVVAAPTTVPAPIPAVAQESSPSVTDTNPPPAAPSAQRAEFGFER